MNNYVWLEERKASKSLPMLSNQIPTILTEGDYDKVSKLKLQNKDDTTISGGSFSHLRGFQVPS